MVTRPTPLPAVSGIVVAGRRCTAHRGPVTASGGSKTTHPRVAEWDTSMIMSMGGVTLKVDPGMGMGMGPEVMEEEVVVVVVPSDFSSDFCFCP